MALEMFSNFICSYDGYLYNPRDVLRILSRSEHLDDYIECN